MRRPLRRASLCAGVALCFGVACQAQDGPPATPPADATAPQRLPGSTPLGRRSPLGINLNIVADHAASLPFVDVFKCARPWWSQPVDALEPWDTREPLDLDPQGYVASLRPGQAAATLLLRELQGHYPGGRYLCLYEGKGEIEVALDARVVKAEPGRLELEVSPSHDGILFRIVRVDPERPIRNIRVIMPGFWETYAEQLFYPLFLERLRPFRTIRFVRWMRINELPPGEWAQRVTPQHFSQGTPDGVCLEYLVALANRSRCDPWFNLPFYADNDYVERFARYVHKHLDPKLRVHIEYCNEVWHPGFAQYTPAGQRGKALAESRPGIPAQQVGRVRYVAQRSLEIFAIWERVFGGSERLNRVIAGFADWPAIAQEMLDYREAYRRVDTLAICAYFGGDIEDPAALDLDGLFARLQALIDEQVETQIIPHHRLARQRGLRLVAYEGGQHLVLPGYATMPPRVHRLFTEANRDPRMKALYLRHFRRWRESGGQLFLPFCLADSFTRVQNFGLLEFLDRGREDSPKWDATLEFIEANRPWWR